MKTESSYIKNVYLPIFNYEFDHGPTERDETNPSFKGRGEIIKRIQLLFSKSKSTQGAYLITGYRGMGKTSVVREAFNSIGRNGNSFKDDNNYTVFNFSLSQDSVRDIDLLRQIGKEVIGYAKENILQKYYRRLRIKKAIFRLISLFIAIVFPILLFSGYSIWGFSKDAINNFWESIPNFFVTGNTGFYLFYFGFAAILYSLLSSFYSIRNNRKDDNEKRLLESIHLFERRLYSSVVQEDKEVGGINLGQNNPVSFIANRFFYENDSDKVKNIQSYEIANSKEIESYLYKILDILGKIRDSDGEGKNRKKKRYKLKKFVFIVDELDKVEPDYIFSKSSVESDEPFHHISEPHHITTKARQRQDAIAKLLANLKNFLSDANAKFIFIGGRDMYDASLADIADRESFYSSIFNEVIYVESFFKDKTVSNAGLSQMVEQYVFQFLFPTREIGDSTKIPDFLKHYVNEVVDCEKMLKRESSKALVEYGKELMENSRGLKENDKEFKALKEYRDKLTFLKKKINTGVVLKKEKNLLFKKIILFKKVLLFKKVILLKRNLLLKKNLRLKKLIEGKELEQNEIYSSENINAVRFKIVHLLQNFFLFLIYRSNGSPKKLIELIERYIVSSEEVLDQKADFGFEAKSLVASIKGDNTTPELYLRFSFYDQYEINLTSNFYRPYSIINSKHLKKLGDKLLYSSAFLMDHILKFHKTAFSWRNLEMLPDIILANKDPNFRHFFQDIMQFLSAQHIRETLNAVFQYKFYSKVKNEMEYLSKISEFSSAAFNFTLDESYHLKTYYKKKLAAKYLEYQHKGKVEMNEYVHSIGYLHSILGDLHFYDEQFDDAIANYTDSIQAIRANIDSNAPIASHKLVLYSRGQLNLGLCLEKTRAYDKAYSIYRTLILQTYTQAVIDQRQKAALGQRIWESPYKRMQLFLKPHIALLGVIEKQRMDGITYDNLARNISEYLKFIKLENLNLFPSKENNSLAYSKIKKEIGAPMFFSKNEFALLSDKKRISTMITDYYVSVGGLLYFKNHLFFRTLYDKKILDQDIITQRIISQFDSKDHPLPDYRPSHAAYLYYTYALFAFNAPYVENHGKVDSNIEIEHQPGDDSHLKPDLFNHLRFILFYLENSSYPILNGREFEGLANIVTKLGDAILTCVNEEPIDFEIIRICDLLNNDLGEESSRNKMLAEINNAKKVLDKDDGKISIYLAVIVYQLAYSLYIKAGNIYSASFQIKKILFVFRSVLYTVSRNIKSNQGDFDYESRLDNIGDVLMKNMIDVSWASNRAQVTKYRRKTKSDNISKYKQFTSLIYTNLSTAPEVKEIICLIEQIKLRTSKTYVPGYHVGALNTVSSMYARIFELKLKGETNLKLIQDFINESGGSNLDGAIRLLLINKGKDVLFKLKKLNDLSVWISDGIFCNFELTKTLNTYGINYILSHTFKASVHYALGKLSQYNETISEYKYPTPYLCFRLPSDYLTNTIGKDFELEVDKYYHFDMAILSLNKAKEMHSEGNIYKSIIRDMHVLDDDFNDNLTHFCAASERLRINLGHVNEIIKKSQRNLDRDSLMPKYKNYLFEA